MTLTHYYCYTRVVTLKFRRFAMRIFPCNVVSFIRIHKPYDNPQDIYHRVWGHYPPGRTWVEATTLRDIIHSEGVADNVGDTIEGGYFCK